MKDKKALGRETILKMFGEAHARKYDELETQGGFGTPMGLIAQEFAFGSIWSRPALDRKYRSMVTIGVLTALHYPEELEKHVRAAVNNGCTAQEIEEVVMQTVPYAGFPAAAQGMATARKVLSELGLIKE